MSEADNILCVAAMLRSTCTDGERVSCARKLVEIAGRVRLTDHVLSEIRADVRRNNEQLAGVCERVAEGMNT